MEGPCRPDEGAGQRVREIKTVLAGALPPVEFGAQVIDLMSRHEKSVAENVQGRLKPDDPLGDVLL